MRTSILARLIGDAVRHHLQDLVPVLISSRPKTLALALSLAQDARHHQFILADLLPLIPCLKKTCSQTARLALSRQLLFLPDHPSFRDPVRLFLLDPGHRFLPDRDHQYHPQQTSALLFASASPHLLVSVRYLLVQLFVPLRPVPPDRMNLHNPERHQQDLAPLGHTLKPLAMYPFQLDPE